MSHPTRNEAVRYRIRPLSVEHLDQVVCIERLSFSNPWSADSFWKICEDPYYRIWGCVHKEKQKLLGYAICNLCYEELNLANLAVHPSYRQQGIGKSLLKYVLWFADRNHFSRVLLEVRVSNHAAIELYRTHGFRTYHIRKNYYDDPVEDALEMERVNPNVVSR